MSHLFILDQNRKIIAAEDVLEWAKWFEKADRVVAQEMVGDIMVSTVFLGVGHLWNGGYSDWGFYFESATQSRDEGWDILNRYKTYDEAEQGHKDIVQSLQKEAENGNYQG